MPEQPRAMPGRVIVLDGELLENDPSSMGKTQGGHITRTVAYPTSVRMCFTATASR